MTNDATAISRALMEPFPVDVIDEKQNNLYIPHEIIRDRLIAATGNQFDWDVTSIDYREDHATKFTSQRTGEISYPTVMVVTGKLSIPGLGTRAGIGVHPIAEGGGEDAYKAAESDALKRAAMAFGCGLQQLYIDTGEAKRAQKSGSRRTTQQRPQTRQHTPKTEAKPDAPTGPRASSMTLEQVKTAAGAAFGSKDMTTLDALIATMPPDETYWLALVKAAPDEKALDWALRKASVHGPALSAEAVQEVDAYRTTLR